jgi:predicted transglutaminase-like cysteine proteinase
MRNFHSGVVRLLASFGACRSNEKVSCERTTDISGLQAARLFRAIIFTLALSLALCFVTDVSDALAGESASAAKGDTVSVFGAKQIKVKKSNSFTSWDTLLKRYAKQEARLEKGRGRINEKAGSKLWIELIDSLQGLDQITQIQKVNSYFNALTYQSDSKNYEMEDYWATPYQFLSRAKGDCEDFAAAKYFALRELGFTSDQLRLVVGFDRARGGAHTVTLAVVDGQAMMLDIGDDAVIEVASVTEFDPLYSVTESAGWLHRKAA